MHARQFYRRVDVHQLVLHGLISAHLFAESTSVKHVFARIFECARRSTQLFER